MNLRTKFTLYLITIHLLFASLAVYLLIKHRIVLIAVELVFALSIFFGIRLVTNLFNSIKLIHTGTELLRDSEFTTRFRPTGQREVDQLIAVYNEMADALRDERTKQQEQNFFLEKVINASPSGIITFDFNGNIVMINPAAERILKLLPATALAELKVEHSRILTLSGRRRIKCSRGQFLDRGFTRDFFLLEELTEELRQIEKTAYEHAIRLMSHEVNNTVGSANSLLHSCLHYSQQINGGDRKDFETAINVIISRTDQLNRFMRTFAEIFRLPPLYKTPSNLPEIVTSITVLFKAEIEKKQIHINITSTPITISLDRAQIEQALSNIIKNAVEAVPINGTINIRITNKFISIEDNGCGFTNNVKENLFTPSFSTKENGQGVGLTLVQEILTMHGFAFSLDTTANGTTDFRITF